VFLVDEHGPSWRPKLAGMLQNEAAPHTKAKLTLAPSPPDVNSTPFEHNQLRYLWTRSADYAHYLQTARPNADFVLQAEIFAHDGKIAAIQVYVFTADGQVTYCRLFNSHHFGPNFRTGGNAAFELIVRHLFEDLHKDAEVVFPPHGVG
jgi:hypothetical protein